jgi:hypothetical protein
MPDDFIDKRNGAYDAVSSAGKETVIRPDADGQPQKIAVNPIPERLERLERPATDPLNPRTGRRPTE